MIRKTFILILLGVSCFIPLSLQAQDSEFKIDTNRISGIEIEEHFSKIDDLLTSERPDMALVYKYADDYLSDNFAMKQRIKTNNAADLGANEATLITRDDVLEPFKDERKTLYNSSLKHRILDIEHNKEDNTAKVTYTSLFKGHIRAMDKDGAFYSQEFITLSQCYDLLKLVDNQVKSFRAECDIEVIQKDPVKL